MMVECVDSCPDNPINAGSLLRCASLDSYFDPYGEIAAIAGNCFIADIRLYTCHALGMHCKVVVEWKGL